MDSEANKTSEPYLTVGFIVCSSSLTNALKTCFKTLLLFIATILKRCQIARKKAENINQALPEKLQIKRSCQIQFTENSHNYNKGLKNALIYGNVIRYCLAKYTFNDIR